MNDVKNIYVEQNADVSVQNCPPQARPSLAKKIIEKVMKFILGRDLDIATFERWEGIQSPRERDPVQYWREMGGRF